MILNKIKFLIFNTYGLCDVIAFQGPLGVECDSGARKRTVSQLSIHYTIEVNRPRREIESLKV